MFVWYNPNPSGKNVGDCPVRAICRATGQGWHETYVQLCMQGLALADMPSANNVWGAYIKKLGFTRHIIPEDCSDSYSVSDFAMDHPRGTYLLALASHVVCVIDGDWHDTWDSGAETPLYYWERTDEA